MDVDAPRGLLREFTQIEDPRMDRTKQHSLPDILSIATCAVICGADGWVQVEKFGRCKLDWFRNENESLRSSILHLSLAKDEKEMFTLRDVAPRPIPAREIAFEPAWTQYRSGEIYTV